MDNSSNQGANNSSDFVRKLYKMLENPQDESIVRWGNEGDSFVVLENEKFTKHILPKHFKHSNFASFVRQLNKYDFHKVRHNNEEGGSSPYGAGAWEFKHPDFKMNNKDALDNIRRKAPAPRKANAASGGDELVPTQQMDLVNTQLVATQQQLQQLQERYNDLSMHHTMLLQELIGVQKTVVNHEHVIQYVMSFLNNIDAQRRRESRIVTSNPFTNGAAANGSANTPASDAASLPPVDDDVPASPLQHASKLLSEVNANHMLNTRNLEQMNEAQMRMNAALTTPPPDLAAARNGGTRSSSRGAAPHSAASSTSPSYGELDNMVYPIGHTQGIDPMYSEHIHNIPYPMPAKGPDGLMAPAPAPEARKKSAQMDPGWIRQPKILLVEDDQTCRRIGGKFLYAFQTSIDSALDGLEAVNKLNNGNKYDLVLMDIIMPNLDGVSATHLVRQFDNTTPIIAMTSNIRSDDISMYFQHGMNDVLPKPFTKEGLLSMLEKHLQHLKKPSGAALDAMPPPPSASVGLASTKRSLKSEDSPATSPATVSNWNSPSQLPSNSPAGSMTADDQPYLSPAGYVGPGMQGPGGGGGMYGAGAVQARGLVGGLQRRGIGEISGGVEPQGDAKRQQIYGGLPPHLQQGQPGAPQNPLAHLQQPMQPRGP
ncbi:unnamed protein product [Zymoseptoria tritici ST99CH_1A5]|uniref:Transcription factor n=4 Tax=Zymoseptoria tritici TaxID=1047171 RepID=F9XE66_ZYMTI|nr:response regulator receiver SKN7p [Zymoseptoria tritici IPO323]EGP86598.1 response regulator receiver SKN7p [Zymoseptoria tritici IPO323]SMQ51997.1 unnamed protein product [Zymoseptoria tritici ST99CH_3D7]SMR54589.1 unnamed protein product [Zymoseptoria tritici ST99CH_1E4]SMY25635.1 unnamed protein product [Zymoseptoria tritici ST99CH_1A5]